MQEVLDYPFCEDLLNNFGKWEALRSIDTEEISEPCKVGI